MNQFLRDKFEVLLVSVVFALVFFLWNQTDFRTDVKEFLVAIFGAWLALLRVVQKPGSVTAQNVSADTIETANTQEGDIVAGAVETKQRRGRRDHQE